ncbi:MAG TPA: sigma-70 family RNA polymerase sigma factor [Thermoanaerobaculia bacterium]
MSSVAAFEQLLTSFDSDRDRAGTHYRDLHRKLVKFFEWQCVREPEAQADEVLDRVLRKVEEGEHIANLPAYAHGVARLVLLEVRKKTDRETEVLRLVQHATEDAFVPRLEHDEGERQQQCFEQCLATLTPENRDIILKYYAGEQRAKIEARRELAASLGMDLNALRVRAHRIRTQLEKCVAQRLASGGARDRPAPQTLPSRAAH